MLPYEKNLKNTKLNTIVTRYAFRKSHHVPKNKNSENTVPTFDTSTSTQRGQIFFSKSFDVFRTDKCSASLSYIKHRLSGDRRFSEISVGYSAKCNNNLLLNYTLIHSVIILGVHCSCHELQSVIISVQF